MKLLIGVLMTLVMLLSVGSVFAQDPDATADVTIIVPDLNDISVSGNASITVAASAGDASATGTSSATTISYLTNAVAGSPKKITGELDALYAAGITLEVAIGAGSDVTLAVAAADLLSNISQTSQVGVTLNYTATALFTAATNNPAGETNTVTYTLTDQ